jgi:spore germination protein GerM
MQKNKFLIIAIIIPFLVATGLLYYISRVTKKMPEPPKEEFMTVKAFFNNDKMDPEFSCNKVFPVEREILKTEAVARAALTELLKGPTDTEKAQGFFTSINPGVKIQELTIENGVAIVDFDSQLEFQVGGSCRVSAIRAEITKTLEQFPTVTSVMISINGRTEDILQP